MQGEGFLYSFLPSLTWISVLFLCFAFSSTLIIKNANSTIKSCLHYNSLPGNITFSGQDSNPLTEFRTREVGRRNWNTLNLKLERNGCFFPDWMKFGERKKKFFSVFFKKKLDRGDQTPVSEHYYSNYHHNTEL